MSNCGSIEGVSNCGDIEGVSNCGGIGSMSNCCGIEGVANCGGIYCIILVVLLARSRSGICSCVADCLGLFSKHPNLLLLQDIQLLL